MATHIDPIDSRLLDMVQKAFPLSRRPFEEIGRQLGIPAGDALARVARLKSEGIIRQISAIFDSSMLGYRGALVAFEVEADRLDDVARAVAEHPGVSHCYSRDASYNLWFTITLPPRSDLETEVSALARCEGVTSSMVLPALKVFKIGVFLSMAGEAEPPPVGSTRGLSPSHLTDEDWVAIRILQQDLPLVHEPFAQLAGEAGMPEERLIGLAERFAREGVMRRFAAVLRHRRAGYRANAMVCWQVDPDAAAEVGERLAAHPSVSHCYQRAVYPGWPFPLYTMVHRRTEPELLATIHELARLSGNLPHFVLRTVKEYKKTRVIYSQ